MLDLKLQDKISCSEIRKIAKIIDTKALQAAYIFHLHQFNGSAIKTMKQNGDEPVI